MSEVNDAVQTEVEVPTVAETAGTDTGGIDDAAVSALSVEQGVPEAVVRDFMKNDKDFAKFVTDGEVDDKGGEEGHAGGDKPAEDSAADGEPKEDEKPAEDNSGAADKPLEFADNVIPEFKGEEMAKLSPEAQEALAAFHQDYQSKVTAAGGYAAKLNALMDDPVIKARAEAIEAGMAADLQVRGMTPGEKDGIIKEVQEKAGLDDDEASEVVKVLGGYIEAVAKDMAQDLANRSIVAADAQRKEAEINRQGNDIMLSLSEFNKDLALNEKDLSKFYVFKDGRFALNESHPEAEKFKNGLGKISEWAGKNGISYGQVVNMGAKAFYAAAAAALDMPVAINTTKRDAKMVAEARKSALKQFLKSEGTGSLDVQGSVAKQNSGAVIKNGYDIIKLAEDKAYCTAQLDKNFNNPDRTQMILDLAMEGEAILNERNKNRR